ncbi:NAD(P)/FAD-dependent oxidoreductase [Xanthobacter sp. ZOL 2024]
MIPRRPARCPPPLFPQVPHPAREAISRCAGGWLHRGGGHINPYAFTVGLARGVAGTGVRIFEGSPATALKRVGGLWQVTTPAGTVRAPRVALATGAHTGDLWPGLRRTFVPVTSYQVATAPLGSLAARILPGDEAFSDTRRDLRYMRKDREGRLVSGAALAIQMGAASRLPAAVRRRLAQLFPELAAVPMPDFWGGRIAMTVDRLPHLHRTDEGLAAWVGCNGRGLALCCGMGTVLADAVLGRPDAELALPPTPPKPLPLHGFVTATARMILPYYRWLDGREVH